MSVERKLNQHIYIACGTELFARRKSEQRQQATSMAPTKLLNLVPKDSQLGTNHFDPACLANQFSPSRIVPPLFLLTTPVSSL